MEIILVFRDNRHPFYEGNGRTYKRTYNFNKTISIVNETYVNAFS